MKNQKAAGYDKLPAELLKAEIEQTTESVLFEIIWKEEKIRSDWQKGLIANYHEGRPIRLQQLASVTLLSITSQVFTRAILMRIESS